ncbi:succinate dehydrogenase / fumarate reductase membrane anchor subunit [Cohaesibacter marisflavi]|uniref:Succinate dehydrogenase hydrophobic membrane anchor subunit n=1 Tax=Cohaesibacter marisflavi TaxID=655353 RepID=A0A1I5JG37_9HYPH|nr:succinate dehydrogenase, hydrophobic membrane anchor protein [Cohaesibacter marisflavi]SFO71757.1 succinate dehydrogenase / fumarate reductase membrane anchor subunit [Cohaesibacter marisflavi]
MKTSTKIIRGLGETHHGTEHHWMIRLTAFALVFLTIGFVIFVMAAAGSDYEQARALVGHPLVAIFLLLVIAVSGYHAYLGAITIPEDYFQNQLYRTLSKILNSFAAIVVCAALFFAVLKVAFGG